METDTYILTNITLLRLHTYRSVVSFLRSWLGTFINISTRIKCEHYFIYMHFLRTEGETSARQWAGQDLRCKLQNNKCRWIRRGSGATIR